MTWFPVILSSLALIVSFLSYRNSRRALDRDTAKLLATSKIMYDEDESPKYIQIHMSNAGRRPMYVRLLVCSDDEGKWVGSYLGKSDTGLKLEEGAFHEMKVTYDDLVTYDGRVNIEATELFVEDSHGQRFAVDNSRENVDLYLRGIPRDTSND